MPPRDSELQLSVREMTTADIDRMVDYFLDADGEFLDGMGVDPAKLPARREWMTLITEDLAKPLPERDFEYLIWEVGGEPVGHCNINKIQFGREAYMHLHVWTSEHRRRGVATRLVMESVRRFCDLFQLVDLLCEPYALNPAPNRTLAKVGFELLERYETTSGSTTTRRSIAGALPVAAGATGGYRASRQASHSLIGARS